ncbi:MAG: aspartate aminotransferase family protein [Lachnospiraceae bacterium]|nr:aspartate aminotransferase family protein [Lachnospiraceae bacterium]
MTGKEYMELTEQNVLHTYNRFPVVFDRGEGVWLTDVDGKKYLDFGAGIAVFALGYGNQAYNDALKTQIDKIIHTSNLYYNEPMAEAAAKLTKASGLDKVFFTNSGTEAVEGALKAARKYAYLKEQEKMTGNSAAIPDGTKTDPSGAGETAYEIIAMNHSFHGRSVGALSVTGNPHYQEAFKPLMGGVKFAEYNNLESVKAQITDRTCAIILETVQGEGGIYPAEPEFLRGVRALCDEHDILLILDEIQCGMGRTGSWFACQQYGVKPDIMTCAKALGCGIPVGAFVLNEKVAKASLVPGDHGTTYGGNPLACAAVSKVFDLFEELHILEHVQTIAPYLEQKLDELVEKYDFLTARRGMGLMQGIVTEGRPVGEIVSKALENGLIVISAEGGVIRFVPPLVIEKEDINEMIRRLEASFA